MAGRRAEVLGIREMIRRLQLGDGIRRVTREMQVSRKTVTKYREWAEREGVLSSPLPTPTELHTRLATTVPAVSPPGGTSKVEPFLDQVVALRRKGLECRAIFDILREEHQFAGSYQSLWRFVRAL